MTVIGVVGGHNREALQALINPLLERGGVTQVRILKLGNNELIQSVVNELVLLHDNEKIAAVDMHQFIKHEDLFTEVRYTLEEIHYHCFKGYYGNLTCRSVHRFLKL